MPAVRKTLAIQGLHFSLGSRTNRSQKAIAAGCRAGGDHAERLVCQQGLQGRPCARSSPPGRWKGEKLRGSQVLSSCTVGCPNFQPNIGCSVVFYRCKPYKLVRCRYLLDLHSAFTSEARAGYTSTCCLYPRSLASCGVKEIQSIGKERNSNGTACLQHCRRLLSLADVSTLGSIVL